jgi:hypothetical protein
MADKTQQQLIDELLKDYKSPDVFYLLICAKACTFYKR